MSRPPGGKETAALSPPACAQVWTGAGLRKRLTAWLSEPKVPNGCWWLPRTEPFVARVQKRHEERPVPFGERVGVVSSGAREGPETADAPPGPSVPS
jgi:poly(3-hydroxyalkanoate) synthetase